MQSGEQMVKSSSVTQPAVAKCMLDIRLQGNVSLLEGQTDADLS